MRFHNFLLKIVYFYYFSLRIEQSSSSIWYNVDANPSHQAYLLVREYLHTEILDPFLSTMFWDIFSLTKRHKTQIYVLLKSFK